MKLWKRIILWPTFGLLALLGGLFIIVGMEESLESAISVGIILDIFAALLLISLLRGNTDDVY